MIIDQGWKDYTNSRLAPYGDTTRFGFCNMQMLSVCHDLVIMMHFAPSAHNRTLEVCSNDQHTGTDRLRDRLEITGNLATRYLDIAARNIETDAFGLTASPSQILVPVNHGTFGPLPRSKLQSGCPPRYLTQWVSRHLIFILRIPS